MLCLFVKATLSLGVFNEVDGVNPEQTGERTGIYLVRKDGKQTKLTDLDKQDKSLSRLSYVLLMMPMWPKKST